ncbi:MULTISPECIES: hypothetical protein [Rhodopseudomonas]|nr:MULTISPECIES: hypothetical protein [Rhodopseudomonas]MDF3812461.1 hypothetical protein [Rhodopseudomonas sp. BAL398]WOK19460.1 hypothetical protein RBJ75_08075 [Rhodopseudomonas sp. BAL398]
MNIIVYAVSAYALTAAISYTVIGVIVLLSKVMGNSEASENA